MNEEEAKVKCFDLGHELLQTRAKLKELEAENEAMRKCLKGDCKASEKIYKDYCEATFEMSDKLCKLEVENKRLNKLYEVCQKERKEWRERCCEFDKEKEEIKKLRKELETGCMLLALNLGNIDNVEKNAIIVNTKKANKDANSWLDFIQDGNL